MRLTNRDQKIKEFLEDIIVADTKTLAALFFDGKLRTAQKRLKILVDNNYIKCFRTDILSSNIFYSKTKPKNWKHKILFSRFLGILKENNIEIIKYKTPFIVGDIIADGFLCLKVNEEIKIFFLEVELTKYFNTDKYIDLYYSRKWKEKIPLFPPIIVITNKKIKYENPLKVIKIDLDKIR